MKDNSRELYLRLLSYVRPHAKVFGLAVIAIVAAAATEPLLPWLIKPLLDGGFAQAGSPKHPPGIYAAALYRYASGDPISGSIDRALLEDAFRKKA